MNGKLGVFIIKDNGADDASLPFFATTTPVAIRQFTHTLRTLPPSCRADFELCAIGSYDTTNYELVDSGSVVSLAKGSDEYIERMIENDNVFYNRLPSVDQLPVNEAEK